MSNLSYLLAATCDPNKQPGDGGIDLGCLLKLGNGLSVKDVYTSPAFLVNLIVYNAFVIAGVLVLFFILLAGFKFISGGVKGKDEAKTIIQSALVGFLLMFTAYWIVQIVEVVTGVPIAL